MYFEIVKNRTNRSTVIKELGHNDNLLPTQDA